MVSDTPGALCTSERNSASHSRVHERDSDGGSSDDTSEPRARDRLSQSSANPIQSTSDQVSHSDDSHASVDDSPSAVSEVSSTEQDPDPSELCCSPYQHFIDTQVGDAYDLKRVVFLPDLHLLLAGLSSRKDKPTKEQAESSESRAKQPFFTPPSLVSEEGNDVKGVGGRYRDMIGQPCVRHAGDFLVDPLPLEFDIKPSQWLNPLNGWMTCGIHTRNDAHGSEALDYSRKQDLSPGELHDIATHCPVLLQWQLFHRKDDSNSIIQSLKECACFPWASLRFSNRDPHSQPSTSRKPDASDAPWATTWIANAASALDNNQPEPWYESPSDGICSHDPRHYLQRMWTQSVVWDTTFMVFHNGERERIGIRNRATQTLFLSDLIVVGESDYYQVHLGLYIAASQDALSRLFLLRHTPPVPNDNPEPGQPRTRSLIPDLRSYVESTPASSSSVPPDEIIVTDPSKYASYRDLLLRVHSGGFYSPHPLLLYRLRPSPGEGVAKVPTELDGSPGCITLTVCEELGSEISSPYVAHRGILSRPDFSYVDVIALLVFNRTDREVEQVYTAALRDSSNESLVPMFYGIFADAHSWMTLLIVESMGQRLRRSLISNSQWEPSRPSLSPDDLTQLKQAARLLYNDVADAH